MFFKTFILRSPLQHFTFSPKRKYRYSIWREMEDSVGRARAAHVAIIHQAYEMSRVSKIPFGEAADFGESVIRASTLFYNVATATVYPLKVNQFGNIHNIYRDNIFYRKLTFLF